MSYVTIKCTNPPETKISLGNTSFAWELSCAGGADVLKDRIYEAIQDLILLKQPVDIDFFKYYRDIDEIHMIDGGTLYEINLNINSLNKQTNLFLPVDIFAENMSCEIMWIVINNYIDFVSEYFEGECQSDYYIQYMESLLNF